MGEYMHPEISMHTHPLADYMPHITSANWRGVAQTDAFLGKETRQRPARISPSAPTTRFTKRSSSYAPAPDPVAAHR